MFSKTKEEKFTLDREIERVLKEMSSMTPGTEQYKAKLEVVNRLCEARGIKSPRALSTDMIVSVVGNLLGILLVMNFEKTGVITTKAFSFIGRGGKGA